jgi:hypothetical protein
MNMVEPSPRGTVIGKQVSGPLLIEAERFDARSAAARSTFASVFS